MGSRMKIAQLEDAIGRLRKELEEALQRGVVLAIKSEKNEHRADSLAAELAKANERTAAAVADYNDVLEPWVLVPAKATRAWASTMANQRQGQSSTPRCEPPGEYEIQWSFDRIAEVLAASPASTRMAAKDAIIERLSREREDWHDVVREFSHQVAELNAELAKAREALKEAQFALFCNDLGIKDRADQSIRAALSATPEETT